MSGGHYQFPSYQLIELAESIGEDFIGSEGDFNRQYFVNDGATPEEAQLISQTAMKMVADFKRLGKELRSLDRLMAGDTSPQTFLEELGLKKQKI